MPDIAKELRHLEEATRLIARGEELVAEQQRRLDRLRKDRHPVRDGERLLQCLIDAVQVMRYTQGIIQGALRDIGAGRLSERYFSAPNPSSWPLPQPPPAPLSETPAVPETRSAS